jgi:hypothetical protein
VDPHISGHHLSFIKIYAAAFAELGCEVAILGTETRVLASYLAGLIEEHGEKVRVYELSRRPISSFELRNAKRQGLMNNLWKSLFAWLDFRDIARAIRKHRLDRNALVFILWLDTYITRYLPAFAVDAVLPGRFAGLYFHPGHLKIDNETRKVYRDLLFYLPLFRSRKLKFVGGFDARLMRKLGSCYRGTEFVTLPDVAEKHAPDLDSDLVREILARARNRKIISLAGSLDRRKNVLEFFSAARESVTNDLFFVCVGKLHADRFPAEQLTAIHEIVAACPDKIFFHDGFVASDRVFDALFVISAAVFAVYRNFPASSNMIVKSALYETPIIVSDEHLMGELVNEYRLGVSIHDVAPKTILCAIQQIVYEAKDAEYGYRRFNESFSFETLKTSLGSLL